MFLPVYIITTQELVAYKYKQFVKESFGKRESTTHLSGGNIVYYIYRFYLAWYPSIKNTKAKVHLVSAIATVSCCTLAACIAKLYELLNNNLI